MNQELIPFTKFRSMFFGKEILSVKTRQPITKIDYYWIATNDSIFDLFNGNNENYCVLDKPGWVDGCYEAKNDPTRLTES